MSETTDRTPTTEEIRRWCMDDGGLAEYHDPINGHLQAKQTAAAFDRWLTAHDTATRTAALEEAAVIARGNLGRIWIATETIHDIAEAILRA